jgi:hypothetical protein
MATSESEHARMRSNLPLESPHHFIRSSAQLSRAASAGCRRAALPVTRRFSQALVNPALRLWLRWAHANELRHLQGNRYERKKHGTS